MATTVFSRILAALAAIVISLSGCGGSDELSTQASKQDQAAAVAFSGPAVDRGTTLDGQPRLRALSAPTSRSVAPLGPTINFSFVLANSGSGAKPAAALAAAMPESSVFDKLADKLEQIYPDLFPGHQQTYLLGDTVYTVRRYDFPSGAANYMGTANGRLYGYGQFNGYQVIDYGGVCEWTRQFVDANSCAPRVESANLISTTTGQVVANVLSGNPTVHARNSKLVVKLDRPINCAGIGGALELGDELKILATASCDSEAGTITLTPMDSWLYGTVDTLTLSGITSRDGYVSAPLTVSFTTGAVQAPRRVYVGDAQVPGSLGANAVHVVNPVTGTIVKEISFPFGTLASHSLVADPLSGKLIVFQWSSEGQFSFVDLEDQSVGVFDFDLMGSVTYTTEGAFLSGNNFCTVFTRSYVSVNGQFQLQSENRFACFGRTTREQTVLSARNSLAVADMITTRVQASAAKVYLVNALLSAWDGGVWLPNTKGELRVFHPTTLALEHTVAVGSVPVDFAVHKTSGDVYVINGGDKSLSIVKSGSNRAETYPLAGYDERDNQRPTNIVLDEAKNRFYISDGYRNVFVYNLATRQEVKRIPISPEYGPLDLALVGNELWVTNAHYQGGSVSVINGDTVTRVITGMNSFPKGIVEFGSP